jgi:hypothetical protein
MAAISPLNAIPWHATATACAHAAAAKWLSRKGEISSRGALQRLWARLRCRLSSACSRRNVSRLPFRRVGRVADTDTADAYTSRTSPITSKANRIDRHLRASTDTIDRLSVTRASFAADVYTITLALDTYCGPTTQDVRTGYEYLVKGLALNPNASSAFRIGRGAYLREMRQTKTTSRTQRSDLRSESSRRSPIVRLIPEGSRRLRPFSSKRFHALLLRDSPAVRPAGIVPRINDTPDFPGVPSYTLTPGQPSPGIP